MDTNSSLALGLTTVLLCTAFIKFLVTLGILRLGLGLHGAGLGLATAAIALVLTLVVSPREFGALGGLDLLWSSNSPTTLEQQIQRYRPFLEKQVDPGVVARLSRIGERINPPVEAPEIAQGEQPVPPAIAPNILVAAFLISEIRRAFEFGLLMLIPFVVIDLLVAHVLLAVGMMQLSPHVVSLPIKLLVFVLVDGWALVTERLLSGYAQ